MLISLRPMALTLQLARGASRLVRQNPLAWDQRFGDVLLIRDSCSPQAFKDNESVKFLQDPDVTNKLSNCKALSDVNPREYDAIFYVGGTIPCSQSGVGVRQRWCWIGYGPVIDLAKDPKNAEIVEAVGLLSLAGAS